MAENLPLGVKLQVIGTEEYKRAMSSAEQSTQKYEKEIKELEKQFPKAASASKQFETQTKNAEQATKKATQATKEAGDQASKSSGAFGELKGALLGVVAGFTAMTVGRQIVQMLGDAIGVTKQYEMATFNLQTQMKAAEREFGLFEGQADSTGESVKALADEFRVFSDRDVATAQARLIQMTKRLGFTEEEMGILLRRTADLSAAQGIDLASGVERVAAAMRGEAESAEYLGLTLNDNYLASQALRLGFEENYNTMSDGEKKLVRYAAFLEQTHEAQGTAADSAGTLMGAQGELNRVWERLQISLGTELLPTLTDAVEILADLTESVDDNRDAIGEWLRVLSPVISKAEDARELMDDLGLTMENLTKITDDSKGSIEDFIEAITKSDELQGFRDAVERIDRALEPYNEQIIAAEKFTRGFFNTVMQGLSMIPGAGILGSIFGGGGGPEYRPTTPYAPGGGRPYAALEQAWQPPDISAPSIWAERGGAGAATQQAMMEREQELLEDSADAWEDYADERARIESGIVQSNEDFWRRLGDQQETANLQQVQKQKTFDLQQAQAREDLEREIGIKVAQGFATPEDEAWWIKQRMIDFEREERQAQDKLTLQQEQEDARRELAEQQAIDAQELKVTQMRGENEAIDTVVTEGLESRKTIVETKEGEITTEIDTQLGDRETDLTDHFGNQMRHLQEHYEKMKAFIENNPLPNFAGGGSGAVDTTQNDTVVQKRNTQLYDVNKRMWQHGGSGVYGMPTTFTVGEGGGYYGVPRPEYVRVTPMGAGGGTTQFIKNYQQQVHMNMGTRSGADAGAIAARVQGEMTRGAKLSGEYGG